MTDHDDSDMTYPKIDDKVLHSAAIIDASGREITITKEMIDQACEQLASQFDQFQHHKPSGQ